MINSSHSHCSISYHNNTQKGFHLESEVIQNTPSLSTQIYNIYFTYKLSRACSGNHSFETVHFCALTVVTWLNMETNCFCRHSSQILMAQKQNPHIRSENILLAFFRARCLVKNRVLYTGSPMKRRKNAYIKIFMLGSFLFWQVSFAVGFWMEIR